MSSDYIIDYVQDEGLAVRTVVAEESATANSTDVITSTTDGKLAVRTVVAGGGSGGDQHNLGYYATLAALQEAHATASAGDFAIIGATDTIWIWDTDTSAWVDSDTKGQVTSVNNKTGAVVLDASDVGAVEQLSTMPTASADNLGDIVQFVGTTDANYTNGYFYENVATTTSSSASAAQTVGSGLSDITVDLETLESFTGWTTDNSLQIFYTADGWSVDTTSLGVTYTGTPNVGDAITITYTAAVTTYAWERTNVQPVPTPAEIGAVTQTVATISLVSTDWSSHSQTKTVTGVTASNTVIVSPAATSAADYAAAEILCTAQGTNSLTFACTTDPANNISVNVVILN